MRLVGSGLDAHETFSQGEVSQNYRTYVEKSLRRPLLPGGWYVTQKKNLAGCLIIKHYCRRVRITPRAIAGCVFTTRVIAGCDITPRVITKKNKTYVSRKCPGGGHCPGGIFIFSLIPKIHSRRVRAKIIFECITICCKGSYDLKVTATDE